MPIQYGRRTKLCEFIKSYAKETFFDQLQALMKFSEVEWEDYDRLMLKEANSTNDMRPWSYQYCTEFGWFQTPSLVDNTHHMRSE